MDRPAPTHERRAGQREKLIASAETIIATEGLAALRARRLADDVGCSVGAIYNLVADLDELVLLVAQRTMSDLNARLDAVEPVKAQDDHLFVAWALEYCAFATEHRNRWRALFEFRLTPGRELPDWFEADQMRLFLRLENGLSARLPHLDPTTLRLRARTLFSAVHGIVALGIEEKIAATSAKAIETELAAFVHDYLAGMAV